MQTYEYKVVSAPRRPKRVKGARTVVDRFARTLTDLINSEAAEGWEYLRAESLPVEEKKGMLSSASENYHSVLVFRRAVKTAVTDAPRQEPRLETQARVAPQLRVAEPPAVETPKPSAISLGPAEPKD